MNVKSQFFLLRISLISQIGVNGPTFCHRDPKLGSRKIEVSDGREVLRFVGDTVWDIHRRSSVGEGVGRKEGLVKKNQKSKTKQDQSLHESGFLT